MANHFSGKFAFERLCRFAWPTIVMMVFMSFYIMVDGVFVARLVGTDALSAVNIFMPFVNMFYAIGLMLATGSAAIVARLLGEGDAVKARKIFTFTVLFSIAAGVGITVVGFVFLDPLLRFLGADGELLALCKSYAMPILPFVPAGLLQAVFVSYFVAAGRPGLGLAAVATGGVTNIVLDYLFMAVLGHGLGGAALATGLGYSVPAVVGLLYFGFKRDGVLHLTATCFDAKALFDTITNGSSEMVGNLAAAVVSYLFNISMLRHIGVDGVAAITIILYAESLLNSIYYGFATGVSPVFSYKYGRKDAEQLKKLFKNSLLFVGASSIVSIMTVFCFSDVIVNLFAPKGSAVFGYASRGLTLFAISFAFMGFNIFFSALFTALSNGKISALLAFSRFVFIAACILALPGFLGVNGIWLAVPVAEVASIVLGAVCIYRFRGTYHYA